MALGLEPGGTIGVLGFNRPEWSKCVLGCMSAGGAAAGIYTTNAPEQVRFILDNCGARVIVVENAMQLAKVVEVWDRLPHLKHVVVMDSANGDDVTGEPVHGPNVLAWPDFLALGEQVLNSALDGRLNAIQDDDLATLIYTSGTTGEPKGVMLSHANLIETVRIVATPFGLDASDSGLSYLPLAHIAEQMMTIHTPAYTGSQIYYVESPEKLLDNLKEVRPTLLFGVPRVWERLYAGIQGKLQQATGVKRALGQWAVNTGRRAAVAEHAGNLGRGLALKRAMADRLAAAKVRRALGFDRLRMGISGAAPIARENLEFFAALGIPIYEVYGLSETTGPLTWNIPGRTRLGTVGPPLSRVEIQLGDDGEVLARGPNIFMGYLNNPQTTAEAMDGGWFHTGDLGSIDDDGYLTITGRKKNLLITSGGKNIAPESLETALKAIELVSEAVVIGDGQRFVAALLTLDEEAAERFAGQDLLAEVQKGVDGVNAQISRVENIRQFRVLPRQLSVDEGELTPTLKVKRRVVLEHWAHLVEEIYA